MTTSVRARVLFLVIKPRNCDCPFGVRWEKRKRGSLKKRHAYVWKRTIADYSIVLCSDGPSQVGRSGDRNPFVSSHLPSGLQFTVGSWLAPGKKPKWVEIATFPCPASSNWAVRQSARSLILGLRKEPVLFCSGCSGIVESRIGIPSLHFERGGLEDLLNAPSSEGMVRELAPEWPKSNPHGWGFKNKP